MVIDVIIGCFILIFVLLVAMAAFVLAGFILLFPICAIAELLDRIWPW